MSHFVCIRQDTSIKLRVLKMSLWLMANKSRRMIQNNTEVLISFVSKNSGLWTYQKNLDYFILFLKSICFPCECHFFFYSSLWPTTICRVYTDAIRQLSRNWSHLLWGHFLQSINSFHRENGSFLTVSYFTLFCLSPLSFISWWI